MDSTLISIVYHSGYGHTRQVAELLAAQATTDDTRAQLVPVAEAPDRLAELDASALLVFGSPTYFGTVSAEFKRFMEATGGFWYRQRWKDKLAAGFTNSSTANGDKLNTLQTLALFAAQHGMHWVNAGLLPTFTDDVQNDEQNRLAGYLGLLTQSDNKQRPLSPPHPADVRTAALFGARLATVARRWALAPAEPSAF